MNDSKFEAPKRDQWSGWNHDNNSHMSIELYHCLPEYKRQEIHEALTAIRDRFPWIAINAEVFDARETIRRIRESGVEV